MFYRMLSAAVYGLDVVPIRVEADISDGLPQFIMVGYLSAQVREAEDRVRTSLRNSDISLIIFTNKLSDASKIKNKKTKLYKSYKFSFYGWSNFKLAVYSLSEMTAYSNRHGKDFAKLIMKNIKNPS